MFYIELFAAILGLISVWLTIRQHIWCFPVGIVMVLLYAAVFYETKLYSSVLLQIIYVLLQVWGWYQWAKGVDDKALPVSWLTYTQILACLGMGIVGTFALGTFMYQETDAAFPYIDAGTTAMSLVAQCLMTYKKIENWILWIIADVIYVFVYVQRDLPITAVLYAIFLIMAIIGLREWMKEARLSGS